MSIDSDTIERLRALAKAASERAYCPYSKFRVGAAVIGRSGRVYTGCNVENASYGLTNCAERTAVFRMVAAGETEFNAIVIYTPTPKATAPCGACRQVLNELSPNAEVISVCDGPDLQKSTVAALLPAAFGPQNLMAVVD